MNISRENVEGLELVILQGEIDMYVAPEVRVALLSACKECSKGVLVDLGNLSYMDSSGIATLIEGLQWSRRDGSPFILVGIQENVLSILKLARLDNFFDICGTRRDALARLG